MVPGLVALVVAYLMSHPNSVYRSRGDAPDEAEILPGMDVRRLNIPEAMAGQSLNELDLGGRFGVSVIGLDPRDSTAVAESFDAVDPEIPLRAGDTSALAGTTAALDEVSDAVNEAMEE